MSFLAILDLGIQLIYFSHQDKILVNFLVNLFKKALVLERVILSFQLKSFFFLS